MSGLDHPRGPLGLDERVEGHGLAHGVDAQDRVDPETQRALMLARRLWRDGHAGQPGLEASDRLLDGTLQTQPGVDVRGGFVAEVREAERRDRARRVLASQKLLVDPGESGRQQPFEIAPDRLEDAGGRLPGPGRGIVLPELGLVVQQAIQHRFPDRLVRCRLAGHGGRCEDQELLLLRHLGDQAQRHGELFQLEVRPQVEDRVVRARPRLVLRDLHARFAERELRLLLLRGLVVEEDVIGDPGGEIILDVLALHEAADLVAADHLQVVREPRAGELVREKGGDLGVRGRLVSVVLLRLLARARAHEDGVVRVLVVGERDEAELVQLGLAPVGDGDLRGALGGDVALVGGEGVDRQALHHATTFLAADGGSPAVLGERVGDARTHRPGGVHPEILVVLLARDVLLEAERLDGVRGLAVGQAAEHPGQGEPDVARVLGVAEGPPLDVLGALEDHRQVTRLLQLGVAVHAEERRSRRRDQRCERRRGDVRQLLEQQEVLRVLFELEVADQGAERLPPRRPELVLVDLLEQPALVELDGLGEVVEQVFLAGVQHADRERGAGLAVLDQIEEAAPRRLELLEFGRMHDLVELRGQQLIDLRDRLVDGGDHVAAGGDVALADLAHELGEDSRGVRALQIVSGAHPTLEDGVEESDLGCSRPAGGLLLCGVAHFDSSGASSGVTPIAPFSWSSSPPLLSSTLPSSSSSRSLPSSLLFSSVRRWRASRSLRSGSTCRTTCSGSKSLRCLNLSATFSCAPSSPDSLFATRRLTLGFEAARTSWKLSRSMLTNFLFFTGIFLPSSSSTGWPERSARTPTTNGSSFISMAPPVSTSYVMWTRGFRTRLIFFWVLSLAMGSLPGRLFPACPTGRKT